MALRADTVVKALRYHRLRCIDVRLDKRSNADLSGSDDGDYTDVEDPNFFFRGVKFKRGQLAYFLPDPEWLGDRSDEQEPLTKDSLEPNDWWLAVVLDCGELNYTDGSSACVLRVAVSTLFTDYSGEQFAQPVLAVVLQS